MRHILIAAIFLLSTSAIAESSRSVRHAIEHEIDLHPENGGHEIVIDARYGKVTLTGRVAKESDRLLIGEIARRQEGVVEVNNQIYVDPGRAPRDGTVDEIKAALKRDPGLQNYSVSISEKDGQIILDGQTGTDREAEIVESTARQYAGAIPVRSQISSPPPLTDREIAARVESALRNDPEVNLSGIEYEVENGRVYFSGRKTDHREIDRILTITLMVPGVRDIRSSVRTGR